MLDIKLIREKPDPVKQELAKVGFAGEGIDRVLDLDQQRRALIHQVDTYKARRSSHSRDITTMDDPEERQKAVAEMRSLGGEIARLEKQLGEVEEKFRSLMLDLPNLPHPRVSYGRDERDNVVVRTEGEPRTFAFSPKAHWDLGPALGIIDFEQGVKLAGSRFYVLKGPGAKLQRALITWMLDLHVREHGYTEIYPPFLVRQEILVGAGQLPKFADNLYHDVEDDIWMIPTAEVPLTNLHRDEILETKALPRYYVAYTPCFRREKMSAGRDVRGIKRGHQFDKVELYKLVTPESSDEELTKLVRDAEEVCQRLEIPHRVVQVCTGDLGFAARMTYDVEMWAPGCGEWLEVSSCSNCGDFQARRANIRYRPAPRAKPECVHTLNGSGLALPRVMIAILENYQQEDGSVEVPKVLRPYMEVDMIGKP